MNERLYQLIDFGGGEKLESLAGHVVRRPSPAAQSFVRQLAGQWHQCDAWFRDKEWRHHHNWPEELQIECGGFLMPVRPTPFGHVGLFPEQADNWNWLQKSDLSFNSEGQKLKALNLFAYTGASTMALVAAGFEVAHVDAAKPNVSAARLAAEINGWSAAPIRYLVDDAAKFAAREVRRGTRYHTMVLDPPAFGHSPKGKAWRLERDLWPLLEDIWNLKNEDSFRILVTGHSPEVDEEDLTSFFKQKRTPDRSMRLRIECGRSELEDLAGRRLDTGFFVRVSGDRRDSN